jgi:hypothetical protein
VERHVIEVIERWLDGFGELDAGIDENGACPSMRLRTRTNKASNAK